MELKGVSPAMVTPLTPEEKVDKAGMRNVVRYCLDGGVHGVVVLGTTGEFPAMTETMRQDAIETVLDEVKGKVPVIVGCGDSGTQKTLLQVRAAASTKANAVLVAVPYYFPVDQAAVIRHFQIVADASPLPVLVYHFPQMTKITYTADTVAKLAAHPNIIGMKDSAGDFIAMQRFIEVTAGQNFAVLSGLPTLAVPAFQLGAKGGIFAAATLFPKLCADLYNTWVKGDVAAAIALQKKATQFALVGSFGPNAAVLKFGLSKLGICGPTVTAPLALAPEQEEKVIAWMRRIGLEPEKAVTAR